jgi:hypothetical protein
VPLPGRGRQRRPAKKAADEKKLAGAAKNSFIKKCDGKAGGRAAASQGLAKDGKKLAGAAKTSFVKKCEADGEEGCCPAAAATESPDESRAGRPFAWAFQAAAWPSRPASP